MRGLGFAFGGVACLFTIAACIEDRPADSGPSATNCGAQTTTPGGCSPSTQDYCFAADAPEQPGCYPVGNSPPSCVSAGYLGCLPGGKRCGGPPCCYTGAPRQEGTCGLTLPLSSFVCDYADPSLTELRARFNNRPCVDPSGNGIKKAILCENDAECARYNAGTCRLAQMPAPVNGVFGVCSDYDP